MNYNVGEIYRSLISITCYLAFFMCKRQSILKLAVAIDKAVN